MNRLHLLLSTLSVLLLVLLLSTPVINATATSLSKNKDNNTSSPGLTVERHKRSRHSNNIPGSQFSRNNRFKKKSKSRSNVQRSLAPLEPETSILKPDFSKPAPSIKTPDVLKPEPSILKPELLKPETSTQKPELLKPFLPPGANETKIPNDNATASANGNSSRSLGGRRYKYKTIKGTYTAKIREEAVVLPELSDSEEYSDSSSDESSQSKEMRLKSSLKQRKRRPSSKLSTRYDIKESQRKKQMRLKKMRLKRPKQKAPPPSKKGGRDRVKNRGKKVKYQHEDSRGDSESYESLEDLSYKQKTMKKLDAAKEKKKNLRKLKKVLLKLQASAKLKTKKENQKKNGKVAQAGANGTKSPDKKHKTKKIIVVENGESIEVIRKTDGSKYPVQYADMSYEDEDEDDEDCDDDEETTTTSTVLI